MCRDAANTFTMRLIAIKPVVATYEYRLRSKNSIICLNLILKSLIFKFSILIQILFFQLNLLRRVLK